MRGKMRNPDPGQDKKSGVIGKQVPSFFQGHSVPADKFVSGADMVRSRGKSQAGDRPTSSIGDIFEMLPYRLSVTKVMKLVDKAVEQLFIGTFAHLL